MEGKNVQVSLIDSNNATGSNLVFTDKMIKSITNTLRLIGVSAISITVSDLGHTKVISNVYIKQIDLTNVNEFIAGISNTVVNNIASLMLIANIKEITLPFTKQETTEYVNAEWNINTRTDSTVSDE